MTIYKHALEMQHIYMGNNLIDICASDFTREVITAIIVLNDC